MSLTLVRHPLKSHAAPAVSPSLMQDCGLETMLGQYLEAPVSCLTTDPEALAERSGILRLLLAEPALLDAFRTLQTRLDELKYVRQSANTDPIRILDSLRIFPEVCSAVRGVLQQLDGLPAGPLSEAAGALRDCETRLFAADYPAFFAARLPERPVAVSYRLHFDDEARLASVTLTEAHGKRFQKAGLLGHDERDFLGQPIPLLPDDRNKYRDTLREQQVCKLSCDRLLAAHTAQGKRQSDVRAFQILQELSPLHEQLAFFTGAAAFVQTHMTGGYCFAEPAPAEQGVFDAADMYHPHLDRTAVKNSLRLDRDRGIALVGGENRGGKTTFLRTAMAVQVLFQLGLPVPAARACLSPAEALYCVFDRDESRILGQGKLGEELTQMREALTVLNDRGFFVFNEPLTSTSPQEGIALSQEALCVAKLRGARGIWVTHFLSLFGSLGTLNETVSGSPVFPLRTAGGFGIVSGVPKRSDAARVFQALAHPH